VQLLVGGRCRVEAPALFGDNRVQLRMDVAPLAHTAWVNEAVAQALFLLPDGQLVWVVGFGIAWPPVAPPGFDPVPQLQGAAEFRLLVIKGLVLLVGSLCSFQGPVAHILPTQGGSHDQHFGQGVVLARFKNHAADARVQWQLRQLQADRCQLVLIVDGAQLGQQRITVGDRLARRRLDERKVLDHPQPQ